MSNTSRHVDLGFQHADLPQGTHVCQIYTDDAERDRSILDFLLAGQAARELSACFSDRVDESALEAGFAVSKADFAGARRSGGVSLCGAAEVYFADGVFDPDRMLDLLQAFHRDAISGGYSAARVIGEMSVEIDRVPGGSRLFEYESRVNDLLVTHPVTAVCQYNANDFDGATIMDVLKVHPKMVVRGAVVTNPFFVSPRDLEQR